MWVKISSAGGAGLASTMVLFNAFFYPDLYMTTQAFVRGRSWGRIGNV